MTLRPLDRSEIVASPKLTHGLVKDLGLCQVHESLYMTF